LREQVVRLGNNNIYGNLETEIGSIIHNPRIVFLVIEDMCLGIFLNHHQASQLPYLANQLKVDNQMQSSVEIYSNLTGQFIKRTEITEANRILVSGSNAGCQKITIDSKWDTIAWNYTKISKLPDWINYISNQGLDLESLVSSSSNNYDNNRKIENIDIEFVSALGITVTGYNSDTGSTDTH
jgi:hypothetical protein